MLNGASRSCRSPERSAFDAPRDELHVLRAEIVGRGVLDGDRRRDAGPSRPLGRARRRRPTSATPPSPIWRKRRREASSGPALRGWRAIQASNASADDQHRESGDEPDRDAAEQRAHQGGRPARQTRSTTIEGPSRRGGEPASRGRGAFGQTRHRARWSQTVRDVPVAGVAFLRRARLRFACAAGRGTAAGPRWRPPCRARPRRCTRPTPGCRASRGALSTEPKPTIFLIVGAPRDRGRAADLRVVLVDGDGRRGRRTGEIVGRQPVLGEHPLDARPSRARGRRAAGRGPPARCSASSARRPLKSRRLAEVDQPAEPDLERGVGLLGRRSRGARWCTRPRSGSGRPPRARRRARGCPPGRCRRARPLRTSRPTPRGRRRPGSTARTRGRRCSRCA